MIQVTNEERAVFNKFMADRNKFIAEGKMTDKVKIVWDTLRLESAALATQQNILFACNVDDQTVPVSTTEIRLQKTDSFVITRMGIYIAKYTTATGRQSARLRTYPNPNIFTAAGEADALQAIYNANLSIMVNNDLFYPQLDTNQFLMVPIQGEKTGTVTAPVATYSAGIDRDPIDNRNGMIEALPTCTLFGGKNNKISIPLATSVAMASAAGSTNIVVVMFRGFLLQNWNVEKLNQGL